MTGKTDTSRWSGAKAAAFLRHLAQGGKVAPAARSVGMTRQAAYRLRRRAPRFAELWELALAEAARQRTLAGHRPRGTPKPVHPLLARHAGTGGTADAASVP